jgi:hypothetical protein
MTHAAALRRQCLALNASERIFAVIRLYARVSMPPLSVVVMDRLLEAGPAGMSVDDLSTLLGLPSVIVSGEIDTLRVRFLDGSSSGAEPSAAPGPSTDKRAEKQAAASLRYVIDLRKALPIVHASISLAYVSLLTVPACDVPHRLAVGLSESASTAGDKKAAIPCICCSQCAMAVQTSTLVGRMFCKSCGENVGLRGAQRVAEWLAQDPAARPSEDNLPFLVPACFAADPRLAMHATMFAALFDGKFCCLSPNPVVAAASDFLTPEEKRRFAEQSGSLTLKYAQPRQLRVAVCTRQELRAEAELAAGGQTILGAPGKLPPWLAEDANAATRAGESDAVPQLKMHRPELVCASQLPPGMPCATGMPGDDVADDDDSIDFDTPVFGPGS